MENIAEKGDKTSGKLRSEMSQITNFCRDETSIELSDLLNYILYGITLYALHNGTLSGVITFDINADVVNIRGLCTPEPSVGVGSQLLNAVKSFAENNNMKMIKLTCYGNVVNFYTKNGFRVQRESIINTDSDSDSDSEPKIRYDMAYMVISGGKKRRKTNRRRSKGKQTKRNKTKRNKMNKSYR